MSYASTCPSNRSTVSRVLLAIVASTFCLDIVLSATASAGDRIWFGNTGPWATPANWSPAFVPVVGDHAVFSTPTGYTVQVNGNKVFDVLDFTSGAGTFTSVSGGPWSLRMIAGTGLNLDAGLIIGQNITFNCDQTASIEAEFKLLGSATLNCDNLNIGTTTTNGFLEAAPGVVDVDITAQIGNFDGSYGRLTLEGASTFTNDFITYLLNGEMYVSGGADALLESFFLSGGTTIATSAVATVTGAGSQISVSAINSFEIGNSNGPGTARVRVLDQAKMITNGIEIWPNGTLEHNGGTVDGGPNIHLRGGTWTRASNTSLEMNDAGYVVELTEEALIDWASANQFGSHSSNNYGEYIISEGSTAEIAGPWSIGNDAGTYGRTRVITDFGPTVFRSSIISNTGGDFSDLIVGNYGQGQLYVEDGSLCEFDDDFIIGAEASGTGTATISGESNGIRSTIDISSGGASAEFIIGKNGSGSCFIEGGALVQVGGDVSLATQPLTLGTMFLDGVSSGHNSEVIAGGKLNIGGSATAAGGMSNVFVENGAEIHATQGIMVWHPGDLYVMNDAKVETQSDIECRGGVQINKGGRLDALTANIRDFAAGSFFNVGLAIDDEDPILTSTVDLSNLLYVGGHSGGASGHASLRIGPYGAVRTRGGRIWQNGTLWLTRNVSTGHSGVLVLTHTNGFTNDGAIYGDGRISKTTFSAVTVHNNGHVYPGIPITIGSLSITDMNVNFNAAGTVHFDLAGTGAGEYDTMVFPGNGTINLGGTLNVNFINGFTPQLNDQFTIIPQSSPSSGDLVGAFSTVTGPAGYDFAQVIFPEHMVLIVNGVPCPADLAGNDGIVNVSDLFALLANWDTSGPGATLAPPNDIVNTSDLFALLAAWGTCPQ